MSLTESDWTDAGEYVLAMGASDERRRFETALLDDSELAGAVWQWEERFRPLAVALRPRPAPQRVWRAIETRVFGTRGRLRAPRRTVRLWRGLATSAVTLSLVSLAALAVVVARPELVRPDLAGPSRQDFIAAIARTDGTVVLARLTQDGRLLAQEFGAEGPDRVPELWLVPEIGSPVSLGLLDADSRVDLALPQDAAGLLYEPGSQFVVTAEPEGGSPTGQPTGPALGAGRLSTI